MYALSAAGVMAILLWHLSTYINNGKIVFKMSPEAVRYLVIDDNGIALLPVFWSSD